jgi:hypothetical protein
LQLLRELHNKAPLLIAAGFLLCEIQMAPRD